MGKTKIKPLYWIIGIVLVILLIHQSGLMGIEELRDDLKDTYNIDRIYSYDDCNDLPYMTEDTRLIVGSIDIDFDDKEECRTCIESGGMWEPSLDPFFEVCDDQFQVCGKPEGYCIRSEVIIGLTNIVTNPIAWIIGIVLIFFIVIVVTKKNK